MCGICEPSARVMMGQGRNCTHLHRDLAVEELCCQSPDLVWHGSAQHQRLTLRGGRHPGMAHQPERS